MTAFPRGSETLPADPERAPDSQGWPPSSFPLRPGCPGSKSRTGSRNRSVPRAPSPAQGVTLDRGRSRLPSTAITPSSSLLRAHAPVLFPPLASVCSLVRAVLAGCGQPLLGTGLSRRYLCHLSPGAWTLTPPRSPGALTRCFPKDIGLTSESTGSARKRPLPCNFDREGISGLQSFAHVQAPGLARPPGCAHRQGSMPLGQLGRLLHAILRRLPAEVVVSLRV